MAYTYAQPCKFILAWHDQVSHQTNRMLGQLHIQLIGWYVAWVGS